MDKKVFYDAIRSKINLTEQNVFGFEKVLDYALTTYPMELNRFAYLLSTVYWETGGTMAPVIEAHYVSKTFEGAEAWRKKNLRYYPWHGRGLIQLTWEANYVKMGQLLNVDFTKNPDMVMEWKYTLPITFIGMDRGIFTGKKMSDYIDAVDENDAEDLREFANARRVVNGTDQAAKIGERAIVFERALRKAKYTKLVTTGSIPLVPKEPEPAPVEVPATQPTSEGNWFILLLRWLFGVK